MSVFRQQEPEPADPVGSTAGQGDTVTRGAGCGTEDGAVQVPGTYTVVYILPNSQELVRGK